MSLARLHSAALRTAARSRLTHLPLLLAVPPRAASFHALAHNTHALAAVASTSPHRLALLRTIHANARWAAADAGAGAGKQQQQQQQQSEQPAGGEQEGGNAVVGIAIIVTVVAGVAYFLLKEPAPEDAEPFWVAGPKFIRGVVYGNTPLLPPESLDASGRRPRTLVLSFDKTLVHCSWSRATGWEVRKRPGVDAFIERLHQAGYELVLWANMPSFEVEPTLLELDSQGYFKHKLYNESTNFKLRENGAWSMRLVKDIARLQRDPKRLIVVDVSADKYAPMKDTTTATSSADSGKDLTNVLKVKPFIDDLSDRELPKLLKVLEDVKRYNVHDVTQVVAKWNENPDADLFEKERAAAEMARRNLKGEKKQNNGGGDAKDKATKEKATDATAAKEASGQSWASWVKGKFVSAPKQ